MLQRNLEMLQDCVWPVISQTEKTGTLCSMQDGTPSHFAVLSIHGCMITSQCDGLVSPQPRPDAL
jgi:hypothetical protein